MIVESFEVHLTSSNARIELRTFKFAFRRYNWDDNGSGTLKVIVNGWSILAIFDIFTTNATFVSIYFSRI